MPLLNLKNFWSFSVEDAYNRLLELRNDISDAFKASEKLDKNKRFLTDKANLSSALTTSKELLKTHHDLTKKLQKTTDKDKSKYLKSLNDNADVMIEFMEERQPHFQIALAEHDQWLQVCIQSDIISYIQYIHVFCKGKLHS